MTAHDRNTAVTSGHHHVGHFHRFGEHQPAMLVDFAATRLAARHQFLEIARFVIKQFDKRLVDHRSLPHLFGNATFEQLDDLVAARGTWADYQCDEEAVDEHPLPVDPPEIGAVEIGREPRFEGASGILIDPHSDQMGPDRQPFIMEVAQQPVELGVPVVEVAHIGGLECTALQLESQHDVTGIERNHVLIQMPCVRQEFGWVGLSLRHLEWHPVGRSVQPSHDGQNLCGEARRAAAANSYFRPRMCGCDCRAWCGPTGTEGGRR